MRRKLMSQLVAVAWTFAWAQLMKGPGRDTLCVERLTDSVMSKILPANEDGSSHQIRG